MARSTRVYHLVPDSISGDTVAALEQLLEDARRGRIVGIAFGVMYSWPEKDCAVNTAGECRRSPIFTRGIIKSLDDLLGMDVGQPSPHPR